jgi:hypothetical protein
MGRVGQTTQWYMETYREGICVRKDRKEVKEDTKHEYVACGVFVKRFYFLSIYSILILDMERKERIWGVSGKG